MQGEGHGQSKNFWPNWRPSVQSLYLFFVSWQSDHFLLRCSTSSEVSKVTKKTPFQWEQKSSICKWIPLIPRRFKTPLKIAVLGWGLLRLRSLISPLREILILQKYSLDTYNHVHICQVSPQLSCGDTCQRWTWYHSGNHCFHHSEKSGK